MQAYCVSRIIICWLLSCWEPTDHSSSGPTFEGYFFPNSPEISYLNFNKGCDQWIAPLPTCHTFLGGGAVLLRGSTLASHPAAPGLNPGSVEIFYLYCLVCEQYWDKTHLVLSNGFCKSSQWWRPDDGGPNALIQPCACVSMHSQVLNHCLHHSQFWRGLRVLSWLDIDEQQWFGGNWCNQHAKAGDITWDDPSITFGYQTKWMTPINQCLM